VIVAGSGVDEPGSVQALSDATGWPVLADPLSGCQRLDAAVVRFDALLRHAGFANDHRPAVALQLGMPPASKVLAQWLARSDATHVALSPTGLVSDPNLVGARQLHGPVGLVCSQLAATLSEAPSRQAERGWIEEWLAADQIARATIETALAGEQNLSEPGTARAITASVPSGGHLVVASSMPVRDVEWFGAPRSDVAMHANRGANGIDGVIATAIGVAIGSREPTAVLLGDVAFCHDLSSLTALQSRNLDLTIVVTDNDGGAIFSFLLKHRACRTTSSSACSARHTAPTSWRSLVRSVCARTRPRRQRSSRQRSTNPTPVWFVLSPIARRTSMFTHRSTPRWLPPWTDR
jgi:2-succinyl-5-enolpyruvyl-6-hydroxy-3-cyclohexene-1-carboxylate synthase